jgi:hypothetical protein
MATLCLTAATAAMLRAILKTKARTTGRSRQRMETQRGGRDVAPAENAGSRRSESAGRKRRGGKRARTSYEHDIVHETTTREQQRTDSNLDLIALVVFNILIFIHKYHYSIEVGSSSVLESEVSLGVVGSFIGVLGELRA